MKNISSKLIFLLISIAFFYSESFAQEIKFSKRVMTNDEFVKLKKSVGTYEEGKNYNEIINGHGTGLMPPTEEQWKEMRNQQLLIDRIEFPHGISDIPASHDNSATIWFPPIGNQGSEGSCVSWACVYYTKTFQEAKEHNWDLSGCSWEGDHPSAAYQNKIFSPDFVYHQVNSGSNNGSDYGNNMAVLKKIGCCTWNKMPNDPANHTAWPNENAWRQAPLYRSQTGYTRLFVTTDDGIANLKQLLISGNLAIISIDAGYFSNLSSGDFWTLDNYNPSEDNHANTIVGYDDNYGPFTESGNSNTYGAFKVANSWGKGSWENISDGFYYISYECMKQKFEFVMLYQNYIDYEPKMLAVFKINGGLRNENLIDFGIGIPSSPDSKKNFCGYNGGNVPFPDNLMAMDITEFTSYMSGSISRFFISVYEDTASASGTIQHFSVEVYDDYETGIPKKVYVSNETPVSTQQFDTVYANVFIQAPETIVITSPKGGEKFEVASNPIITYTSAENSGYLNLDYSTDGGATWNTIATNQLDDGDYRGWILPNTPSVNCKISITDADGYPSAISNGLFTIQSPGTFIITSPKGGEEWKAGGNPVITYSSLGNSGYVDLDYSTDGGVTWDTIAAHQLDDGEYEGWIVPNTSSANCKIRISDADGFPSAVSNGLFSIGSDEFTEQTSISITGIFKGSVAWGDYDNDNDLDLLLTGDGVSKIYRNNGDNTFTEQTSISLIDVINCSAAWGDYDNDNDLDILVTGYYGYLPKSRTMEFGCYSRIYRNDGENVFTETQISLEGVSYSSAAWGDCDNDGDLDILLSGVNNSGYNVSKIYNNNGNNIFAEQTAIPFGGVAFSSAAWGDYDNDGDLDILFSNRIYRNDGYNIFTEQTSISLLGGWSSVWGDYDNDGNLDILLTGGIENAYISKIYRNNGDNTFTEQTSITLIGVLGSAAWGDYDNDGDLDILLNGSPDPTNGNSISKIYRNNGDNTFTERTSISLMDVGGPAGWGDYDNDGDLDIFITGYAGVSGRLFKIYRNNIVTKNNLPAAPSDLSAAINGNDVTFSWNKSNDIETPQNGLRYNLVIGTSPNDVNIMSPMSDRSTGFRRVVNLGNTNHNTSWTIKGLPDGQYYWSVQAIDNCFAGSQFAPEQIISLPIPVELTSFKAVVKNNNVLLEWKTATETNNKGFEIERRVGSGQSAVGNWEKIGFVEGAGTSLKENNYNFSDNSITVSGNYIYRLKQIDYDGTFEYSDEVTVEANLIPDKLTLSQNYPNPFNPSTTIRYGIPAGADVKLVVYGVLGNEVAVLVNEKKEAGSYEVVFDGSGLANGIYVYRLQAGNSVQIRKMILLK